MAPELRRITRCTSCDAPIIWAETSGGKAVPIDAAPVPDGSVALYPGAASSPGKVLALFGKAVRGAEARYKSHFATCPQAAAHRKAKPAAKAGP